MRVALRLLVLLGLVSIPFYFWQRDALSAALNVSPAVFRGLYIGVLAVTVLPAIFMLLARGNRP